MAKTSGKADSRNRGGREAGVERQGQGEEVIFDNLQSQDDPEDGVGCLKGPVEFTLDDCELGRGVMQVIKSMSKGEVCEAWLDPDYAPGEASGDGDRSAGST